ncbi:DUF6717 family protein [Aquirufa lenticrescens]|uniref:DUF6717 family protein n=1 Tax=Aquirufa lenticrescens TaxID=2696560 RepID=UPI001CAA5CCC|nr:DUF6717 family protein [Aquirufa lenticrescens]UAJ14351.1 hypothetical protein G9X62_07170 [Aquirufa lenticrescens]
MKRISFIKEIGLWYADLPEFLEQGLGTKNNLLMVDGADTFLDLLSRGGDRITLDISLVEFEGYYAKLEKVVMGKNQELLDAMGHEPVEYGAYYEVNELDGKNFSHPLWLCPVTEYVFGEYPMKMWVRVVDR